MRVRLSGPDAQIGDIAMTTSEAAHEISQDPRLYAIGRLIHEYASSPFLKHIRDANVISKLTRAIAAAADGPGSPWGK